MNIVMTMNGLLTIGLNEKLKPKKKFFPVLLRSLEPCLSYGATVKRKIFKSSN